MISRRALLLRVSVVGLVGAASPAFAQGAVPASKAKADPSINTAERPVETDSSVRSADGEGKDNGQIIVTGSRIKRPNYKSLEPTVTVDEKYIKERGITNVADALNELPAFRNSVTPAGTQGSYGQGVNFVNNFGLGSNRTLTLINGRRFVSSNTPSLFGQASPGTQVDLNIIPSALVDRIDTVSIGGAPIYGSDAISGTVNVILKNNFKGIEASATTGITSEGDNFRYNVSLVAGHNFASDRGNITLSYSRDKVEGVLYNSRDYLRENNGNVTNPSTEQANALRGPGATFANDGRVNPNIGFNDSATDGFPGTVLIRDQTLSFLTQGGLITGATGPGANNVIRYFQFDRQGNLVPFNRGIPFVGTRSSGGDGFRFSDYSQITSNLKRQAFNGFLNFRFSDAFKIFAEATYYKAVAHQLVRQPSFNSSLFGGANGALTFDTSSAFLTPQARDALIANGVKTFKLSRASVDLADLTGVDDNTVKRGVIGVKGDFQMLGRNFNYEVSGNMGRSKITDFNQDINKQNFINAVNVTRNASGNIVCTTTPKLQAAPGGTPIADPACVPLNLLGFGVSSQAARDYVIANKLAVSVLKQKVFNANFGGGLFDLPGGALGFNLGYEHREERGSFVPDDFSQRGLGRSSAVQPVSGRYKINEFFGEVSAPLVGPSNRVPVIYSLQVFARGRHVNNSVNGKFNSYAAGGSYAPIQDLELRGNYTKSFRAPAITELFLPASPGFNTIADLCSPGGQISGPDPVTRARNCAAFLAAFPNATPLDAAGATVPSISGGNPNLKNEVARSLTYGMIIRPRFIPGLTASADYIRINIANPISNLSAATINGACFDNPQFNTADPANGNAFCSLIRRYPAGTTEVAANGKSRAGQVVYDPANPAIRTGFVNGNKINFTGIQFAMDYRANLSGLHVPGALELSGTALFVKKRIVDITGIAPVRTDGELGDPKFSAQMNVRYLLKSFGANTSINFTGKQLFSRQSRSPDSREIDYLKPYALVNAGVYFDVGRQYRLSFAVSNLFDRRGQRYNGVIIPASYDDLLGRRYAVTARVRF